MAKKAAKTDKQPANVMDYAEHERTYEIFLKLSKWVTVGSIAAVVALAVYGFTGAGVIGAFLSFFILCAIALFFL